jgi:hypothetical protein
MLEQKYPHNSLLATSIQLPNYSKSKNSQPPTLGCQWLCVPIERLGRDGNSLLRRMRIAEWWQKLGKAKLPDS